MLDPRIHYTQFPWDRFKECVRATNAELWNGPLGSDYWTEVDPLEHYEWRGFQKALDGIREMLEDLPSTIYVDEDNEIIGELDPYVNPNYWEDDPEREGEYLYYGPWDYSAVNVAEILLPREVYTLI